ncbi:DUF6152 family protein [Aquabacterium humicola]|uniref:DUF6152 family protein n=1 Tax=Aquabacterium humicola TaxID=3237377 RepID=UPI002543F3DD|nr:DUF6152 family protein [Rubrivivax pictus]
MQRRLVLIGSAAFAVQPAFAHHGWSSFDQSKPIYVAGQAAKVAWRNPHVEIELDVAADLKLPADLAQRPLPAQSAPVDGPQLLKAAAVPKRKDKRWEIEFAPLTRMQAWGVPEIKVGDRLEVLGFSFPNEQGEAILRAEFLWLGGKTYALRSSPA